jgi:hypothetical protein
MSNNIINFIAIGSDPEFFLLDENNLPVSSEGLVGGSKAEPRILSEEGHMVQEDNVMIEMNIPPVRDKKRFISELNKVIQLSYEILPTNLKIVALPSMVFDPAQLTSEQACTVGCEPDYNVYARMENESPNLPLDKRYAGGHIHISYENPIVEFTELIVKSMDMFLGVPSVILDTDDERKAIYGKAGRFRFKSYGVEYRTLSNFWLQNNDLMGWVFDQTITAVNNAPNYENSLSHTIESIINNNDKKEAIEFCKKYNIQIPEKVTINA